MALGLGHKRIPKRLLWAGTLASILPDLDVVAFRLGVPYAADWGHRGFSHSLLFALIVACAGAACARQLHATAKAAFGFLLIAAGSHGLLDALTNGGLGIAMFWPISSERFFLPWHPIEVSPLAISGFFSQRGLAVLWSEFLWVWLPCLMLATIAALFRRGRRTERIPPEKRA